jgi:hypothetical protein
VTFMNLARKGTLREWRAALPLSLCFQQLLRGVECFFESYGFIHGCIIINDKELVIRNDSMGGHIHIITSLGTTHGFLCRRHFLANVLRVIGTELWFC